MKFIDNLKQDFAKKSEQNRMVRDKMAEIELDERMKQAEVVAREKIKARANKKIESFKKKKEGKGFFDLKKDKEEDRGHFDIFTGKWEKEKGGEK